jgi:glycosyltransferase involved in cell wall biosynthesis
LTDVLEHPVGPIASRGVSLRIAVLSYRSDPNVGGQGVYVDYLTRALAQAGAQVDVISGPPYPSLDPRVKLIKLPSLDLYAQPHNGHYALRPHHLLSPTDTYEYFGHLSGKFVEPYTFGQRAYAHLKRRRGDYDVILDNQTLASGILKVQDVLKIPIVTMVHHPITRDRQMALDAAPDDLHRWLVRRWYAFHRMQIRVARRLHVLTWSVTEREAGYCR